MMKTHQLRPLSMTLKVYVLAVLTVYHPDKVYDPISPGEIPISSGSHIGSRDYRAKITMNNKNLKAYKCLKRFVQK